MVEVLKISWNSSLMLDELVVLVLCHELYLCTCKMRLRDHLIIKKLSFATFFVIIINVAPVFFRIPLGFTDITTFDALKWWKIAITDSNSWDTVTSIFVTGSVLYLGVHVFRSLKKSKQLRNDSNQNKYNVCNLRKIQNFNQRQAQLHQAKTAYS